MKEIALSRTCFYNNLRSHDESKLELVLEVINDKKSRSVRRAINGKISNWLTVVQISKYQFDLSPIEFRDALALRYHRPLLRMSACCDCCGAQSSLGHTLDCKKRGLVTH